MEYFKSGIGEKFHDFVAFLKLSIANGDKDIAGKSIQTQLIIIQDIYEQFIKKYKVTHNQSLDIWESYIEPWVIRKVDELESINTKNKPFFELTVGHPKVPFKLNDGKRHYPLAGRIDEINIKDKLIIERTLREPNSEGEPPLLKDYQIWLYKKLLCALEPNQLPSQWKSIDFSKFNLVIETPTKDYLIAPNDDDFTENTHKAYAWIQDIAISESPRIFAEIVENEACIPENTHSDCVHPFKLCFKKNWAFPKCRKEIKRTFQPWFRYLLWEQMWEHHLWQYQIMMLNKKELSDLGIILETQILSNNEGQIELEVIGRNSDAIRGYDRESTLISFGTLFCGIRQQVILQEIKGNNLIMKLKNGKQYTSKDALLLSTPDELTQPVMKTPLSFLKDNIKRSLFNLEYVGAEKEKKAMERSTLQLLEAIFGIRELKKGLK